MNKLFYCFFSLMIVFVLTFGLAGFVLAEGGFGSALEQVDVVAGSDGAGYDIDTDVDGFVGKVIMAILSFVGVIFLILMVYGGFIWMNAKGNEDQVGKAKKIIQAAILGVVIIAAAGAISWFVVNQLMG